MVRKTTGIPPWSMAVAAMLLIQLSNALSLLVAEQVGTWSTAWLRMCFGAVFLILIARPNLRALTRRDIPLLIALGVTTGYMTTLFLAAIDRIPIGTAVAIEFLGPLTVAAFSSKQAKALIWPCLALVGVLLLTEPWLGEVDLIGIGFAVSSGVLWGVYIVLTQRAGDRFSGVSALALTIPVAAVATTFVGIPQLLTIGSFDWWMIPAAAGVALITPVISFGLEMIALKRMTQTAFGTLMSVEPAFGALLGLLVFAQQPSPIQIVGMACVVLAGAAAQRGGLREPPPPEPIVVPPPEPRTPSTGPGTPPLADPAQHP